MAEPRSAEQRKKDTLTRLENDLDVWIASASTDGTPYLVPLSFIWDGTKLTIATPESSPTGRNLRATGRVRLALGPTRDVVLIEGTVEAFDRDEVSADVAEAFAARHWDARKSKPRYGYFRITPVRVQAWREENELSGRELMSDGSWLV
jgi:general stress protein 26